MKKISLLIKKIFLFLFFGVLPFSTFASGDYPKDSACKLKDGVYIKNLQVVYPGVVSNVRNFVKSEEKLFYVVNSNTNAYITTKELYTYDCKSKKATLLKTVNDNDSTEGEIDYLNKNHIFVRSMTEIISGDMVPVREYVYTRNSQVLGDFYFFNNETIAKEYVDDFGPQQDTPYRIMDITSGKDGNILIWITWGDDMLRALSMNPKTFIAKNVSYDYNFKKSDNTDAWLKLKGGRLYEKNNAGQWSEVIGIDVQTFRAIGSNYGRDKNGYTTYNAKKQLPYDAITIGYHLWYSISKTTMYSYNLGDWISVRPIDPSSFFHNSYISFDDPNSGCLDTTGSYGYNAQDNQYCYGHIGGSNADFGIVGKIK